MNSQTTKANGLGEWLAANLVAVLGFFAVVGMSYATLGQVSARVDANQLEILKRLDVIDARLEQQDAARTCAIRNIDRLADRAGVALPCEGVGE